MNSDPDQQSAVNIQRFLHLISSPILVWVKAPVVSYYTTPTLPCVAAILSPAGGLEP